jgi:hypothetical protein
VALGIDDYPYTFWDTYSADPSDICVGVSPISPYANSLRVAVVTVISNVYVIASTGNAQARFEADSDVFRAGDIGNQGIISDGDVLFAGGVASERSGPNSRVTDARSIIAQGINPGGCISTAVVLLERPNPAGRIRRASCIAHERLATDGSVTGPRSVAKERIEADGRVIRAGIEAEERIITLSGILIGIPSVWRWVNRSRRR